MKLIPTPIAGLTVIERDLMEDERGFFARTYCRDEFAAQGIDFTPRQNSLSFNRHQGTIRGMHYQAAPYEEQKMVEVISGAIFDVAVDLRPDSDTHGRWFGMELSAKNRRALFLPRGLAHGFQTLTDAAEVLYVISYPYHQEAGRGLRWDDPWVKIAWPLPPAMIAPKDLAWPDYQPA